MNLIKENTTPPKYMEHLIFGALFTLVCGALTSISILALFHILIILPCIYFAFKTNWKAMPKSSWALLSFAIAIILSIALNQDIAVKGWKTLSKSKYFLIGFFSIAPIHWWIKEKMTSKHFKILIYTFLISTSIATWSGLNSTLTGFNPLLWKFVKVGIRNGGLFGMLMNYAHNMSYFLVVVFGMILYREKLKELITPRFLITVFIINAIGLYFSFTRGAWLAVIAGIPMYFYKDHKKWFGIISSGLLVLGVLGFFLAGDKVIRPSSEEQRLSQWEAAFYAFKERPVLGYGYLNFEEHSKEIKKRYNIKNEEHGGHAHNNFMEVLASVGLVGLFTFLLWLFFWFRECGFFWGAPIIVAFVVGGLTQATISLGINLFVILGIYSVMTAYFAKE